MSNVMMSLHAIRSTFVFNWVNKNMNLGWDRAWKVHFIAVNSNQTTEQTNLFSHQNVNNKFFSAFVSSFCVNKQMNHWWEHRKQRTQWFNSHSNKKKYLKIAVNQWVSYTFAYLQILNTFLNVPINQMSEKIYFFLEEIWWWWWFDVIIRELCVFFSIKKQNIATFKIVSHIPFYFFAMSLFSIPKKTKFSDKIWTSSFDTIQSWIKKNTQTNQSSIRFRYAVCLLTFTQRIQSVNRWQYEMQTPAEHKSNAQLNAWTELL